MEKTFGNISITLCCFVPYWKGGSLMILEFLEA
jgi:hypothetical protein